MKRPEEQGHVQTRNCCDNLLFALGGRQPVFAGARGYHTRLHTKELTNLSHGSSVPHDRIPNCCACRDHPLD